jgi:hypothetical protein
MAARSKPMTFIEAILFGVVVLLVAGSAAVGGYVILEWFLERAGF